MGKVYRVFEIAWLIITVASLITALVIYFTRTPEGSYLFFILAIISAGMCLLRRRQRLRRLKNKQ